MSDVQGELNDLRQFKTNLNELMLGQNDPLTEYDDGKIDRIKEVLDLITNSQTSIRDKLLDIVSPKSAKLTLTYSCNEDNYSCSDKSISADGLVESHGCNSGTASPVIGKTNANDKILPISSIDALTKEQVNDLKEIYTKILASVNEQEEFLNEKWKKQSIESRTPTDLDKECDEGSQCKQYAHGSSTNKGQTKMSDTHHWFPNTTDTSSQTIGNSLAKSSNSDSSSINPVLSELSNSIENIRPKEVEDSETNKLFDIQQLTTINDKVDEVPKIDVRSMNVTNKVQDDKSSYKSDFSEEETYCKISSKQVENEDLEIDRGSLILNTESPFNVDSDKKDVQKIYLEKLGERSNKFSDKNDLKNQESIGIETSLPTDDLEKENCENNDVANSNTEQMRMDSMSTLNSSQENVNITKIECLKEEPKTFTLSLTNQRENVIEKINLETRITLENENLLNLAESNKNTVSQTHLKFIPLFRSESQIGSTVKDIDNQEINNESKKIPNEEKELSVKDELEAPRISIEGNDNENINNTEGNSMLETVHSVSEDNSYIVEKSSKIDGNNNISGHNKDKDNQENCTNSEFFISMKSDDEESENQSLYSNYENVSCSDNELSKEKYNIEEVTSQRFLGDQTEGDTSCKGDSINKNQDPCEDLIKEIHIDRNGSEPNEKLNTKDEIEDAIKERNFSNFISELNDSKSDDNQELYSEKIDCINVDEEMIYETKNMRSSKFNPSNDSDEMENRRENQQINQVSDENMKENENESYVNGIKMSTADSCGLHEIKVNDSMIISNTHIDCNEKIKVITKENNEQKTDELGLRENKFEEVEFSKNKIENNSNLENVGKETLEGCRDLNSERNSENPITGERGYVINENTNDTERDSVNVLEKYHLKDNPLEKFDSMSRFNEDVDKSKCLEKDFSNDEFDDKCESNVSNETFKQQSQSIIYENCMNLNDDQNTEKHQPERDSSTDENTNGSENNSSNISEDHLNTNSMGKLDSVHPTVEVARGATRDQRDISNCNPDSVDSFIIKSEKDKDKSEIQEIMKEEVNFTDGSQQKVSSTDGLICLECPIFVPVNTKQLNSTNFKEDGQMIANKSNSLFITEGSFEHKSSKSDFDNGLKSILGNTLKPKETNLQDTSLVSLDTLPEKKVKTINLQDKDDKSDINDEEYKKKVKGNLSNQILKQQFQDSIKEKEELSTHRNVDENYSCENNSLGDENDSMKRILMSKLEYNMDETDDAKNSLDSNGLRDRFNEQQTTTSKDMNSESNENLSETDNINQTNEIIKQENNHIELNPFTSLQNRNDSSISQDSLKLSEGIPVSDIYTKLYVTPNDYDGNMNMNISVDQALQEDVTKKLISSNTNLDFDKSLSDEQVYNCKNICLPDRTNFGNVELEDSKDWQSKEVNESFDNEREVRDANETTLKTNMNEDLYITLNTSNTMESQTSLIPSNDPNNIEVDQFRSLNINFEDNISSKRNFSDNKSNQLISSSPDTNNVISLNYSLEEIEKSSSDSQSDSTRDSLSSTGASQSECTRKNPSESILEKIEASDDISTSESNNTGNMNDSEITSTDNDFNSLSCITYKNSDDQPSKDIQINKVECSNNINLKDSDNSVTKKNSCDNKFESLISLINEDYDLKQSDKTHIYENEDFINSVKRPDCRNEGRYSDNESEAVIDGEMQSVKHNENKENDDERDENYEKEINKRENLGMTEDNKNNETNILSETSNEDLHQQEWDQLPYTSLQFTKTFNVKDKLGSRINTESLETLRESVYNQEATGYSRVAEQLKDNISDSDSSLYNTHMSLPSLKDSQNDKTFTEQSSQNEYEIVNSNLTECKLSMDFSNDEPVNEAEFSNQFGFRSLSSTMPTKEDSYTPSEYTAIHSDNLVGCPDRNKFKEDNDGTDEEGNDNDDNECKGDESDGDGDDEDDSNDEIGDGEENNYNDKIGGADGKDNDNDRHDDGDGNDEDDDNEEDDDNDEDDGNDESEEDDENQNEDEDEELENSECEDKLISPSVYPENQLENTLNENENFSLSNNSYTSKKKRVPNCCLLLLLSLLLAILVLLLFIPNLPIVTYCKNPVYHILQNINPFDIKRSVPV